MKICPVSKKCGGCSYLQVEYEQQLKKKRDYVKSLFPKYNVEPVIGMKDPYHYRHKVYASFSHNRDGVIKCGMYEENTHKVIDTKMCLIQNVQANAILNDICHIATKMHIESYDEDTGRGVLRHAYIRVSHQNGDVLLVLVIGSKNLPGSNAFVKQILSLHPEIKTIILNHNDEDTSMILGKKNHVLYGKGYIEDSIMNTSFRISTNTFYQVNPIQTEKIYQTAIQMAALKKEDTVLDMCCGIGTISLIAAKKANFVLGVEINPDSIKDAINNAKRNHIQNAQFIAEDSTRFLDQLGDSPSVIFLDPPRSGFTEKFIQQLNQFQTERIVYISCNPETQARDIKGLTNYQIKKIVPVDNFPFTKHVETCVLLGRKIVNDKNVEYMHVDYEPEDAEYLRGIKGSATYAEIKAWIKEQYNVSVSSLYIAQCKDACGFEKRDNYNKGAEGHRVPNCPEEKKKLILEAFKHFKMI